MPTPNAHPEPIILRLPDLMEYLSLGRSAIYGLLNDDPEFPARIRLSKRAVGWRRTDIDEWVATRPPIPGIEPAVQRPKSG